MYIKDLVPIEVFHYVRILKARRKYKTARIETPWIDLDSKIAPHVKIAYGADVGGEI